MFSLLSCVSAISLANVETLKINLSRYYPNIQVSNIQTTEIYAKIVDKKKEEAINLIDGMFT